MPNTPNTVEVRRYSNGQTEPATLATLKSNAWVIDDLVRAARNHGIALDGATLKRDIADKLFAGLQKAGAQKNVEVERSVRIKLRGQGCDGNSRETVTIKLVDPDTDENGASQNSEKDRVVFETESCEYFYTTVRDLNEAIEALESVQYDTFGY